MKEKLNFRQLAKLWLEEKSYQVKESTIALYHVHLDNHILPLIGNYSIYDIKEESIWQAILYWRKEGRIDKKGGLSEKTLITIIKSCINFAVRKEYLPKNPIKSIYYSNNYENKTKVFTLEQQMKIIESIKKDFSSKTFGILLCLYTGLRIGEICALQWKDIDFDEKTIFVHKTLQRLYIKNNYDVGISKIIISTPKTRNSVRKVPIISSLLPYFEKLTKKEKNNYILTNSLHYTEPRTYRSYFKHFLIKNKIEPLNFHCLRHTFSTRYIESGGDYKSLSEILGHSNVNITLNLYVHPQMEQKRKCIENMENYVEIHKIL